MPGVIQDRPDKAGIQRQIVLPWSRTLQMTRENIFVRLGRSVITASGIFLGIAFMTAVLFGSAAGEVSAKLASQQLGIIAKATGAEQARTIWLVTMSLVVATVGIVNSMLMSVTERYKEIGTMKCLGALDRFIVRLFILEALLLGVLASFCGALVGTGVMTLVYAGRMGLGHALSSWGQTVLVLDPTRFTWLANLVVQAAWWQTLLMGIVSVLVGALLFVISLEFWVLLVTGAVLFVAAIRRSPLHVSITRVASTTAAIGAILGVCLWTAMVLRSLRTWQVPLWAAILAAIVLGGALSVLATLYPAWRAAKMPPAAALRSEF